MAFVSGGSMVYSQLVTAVFGAFLGAYLGAVDYGVVNLARTVFVVALVATPLGLDLALQRRLGQSTETPLQGEVNVLRVLSAGFAMTIALGLLAGGASALERSVFRYPGFAGALSITMLALPFATDMAVLGGAYRGLLRPSGNLVATYVIQPTIRMVMVLALFLIFDRVTATVAGTTFSFLVAGGWMIARAQRDFPWRTLASPRAWSGAVAVLAYAPILGLSTLVFTLARTLDTMTLAHFAPSAEVGRYAVVQMVGQLVAIIGASLGQTLGARVAAAAHAGDYRQVGQILSDNMELGSILCAPFCVAIALWGEDVDLVLGKSYVIATPVFVVASATQWMMTTTHYASAALSLTGRHRLELENNLVALAAQAGGCLLLVPALGMLGAAASTALSILVLNALRQYQIAKLVGRPVFRWRLLTPLVVSCVSATPWLLLGGTAEFRAWWLTGCLAGGQIVTSFVAVYFIVAPQMLRDRAASTISRLLRRS